MYLFFFFFIYLILFIYSIIYTFLFEIDVDKNFPISVSAFGGKSYVSKGDGTMRTARKWIEHAHVKEIETCLKIKVDSFVPIICYHLPHGLFVVINGKTKRNIENIEGNIDTEMDVSSVLETHFINFRFQLSPPNNFSFAVSIDNIQHVAYLAFKTVLQIQKFLHK